MVSSKVHYVPGITSVKDDIAPCCSLDRMNLKRELFTVWMKSLIMQANGCTVYSETGDVVYRMDNYDTKHSRKIHLMDLRGRLMFTVLKRKFWVFRCWEGYRFGSSGLNPPIETTWFRVTKNYSILEKCLNCQVTIFCCETKTGYYSIEGFTGKSEFSIKNGTGKVIAEVKRKKATSGVHLGEDVQSLVIEPLIDHSFIMALVAVYGSICHRM